MAARTKPQAAGHRTVKNAGPCMAPSAAPGPNHQPGIRSEIARGPWNETLSVKAGRNRARVQTARALDELFPFVGYLNQGLPEEALGDGMGVYSLSKNAEFREQANTLFDLWGGSNKIDVRGECNIYTCQPMLGYYAARDGEVFALKVKSKSPDDFIRPLADKSFRALQLQFIRRDQIGTFGIGRPLQPTDNFASGLSRWDDGIFLDDLDRAVTYRILKRVDGNITPNATYDVPRSQMIHLKAAGLEGIHGQPMVFRGEDCALDALDTRALSKYADKIRGSFLGCITTESGDVPQGMRQQIKAGRKPDPTDSTKTVQDKSVRYFEIAAGVFIPVLKKDEKITFFTGLSNLSFGEQIALLFKEICYAYGVPPEYIWELHKLGSASVRMILRKVVKLLNRIRRPFREIFLQQTWEMVISEAMLPHYDKKGKKHPALLPNVDDWNIIECRAAPDPSIDAGRDENAEQEKLRTFTGTADEYCATLNKDGRHVRHARLEEIADNIVHGASLKRPGLENGLPWYLCVDPKILLAISGIASNPEINLANLGEVITQRLTDGKEPA